MNARTRKNSARRQSLSSASGVASNAHGIGGNMLEAQSQPVENSARISPQTDHQGNTGHAKAHLIARRCTGLLRARGLTSTPAALAGRASSLSNAAALNS